MNKNDLQLLFAYNRWANARVLDACKSLSQDQLNAPAQLSFGSLMGTLVHIFTAEWIWRMRMQQGESPTRMPMLEEFPTLADLAARWQAEEATMQRFVDGLQPEDLERWVEFRTTSGKPQATTLWKALVHVTYHGMQFRAEAGAVLGALGCSPGDIDLIFFLRETDQR